MSSGYGQRKIKIYHKAPIQHQQQQQQQLQQSQQSQQSQQQQDIKYVENNNKGNKLQQEQEEEQQQSSYQQHQHQQQYHHQQHQQTFYNWDKGLKSFNNTKKHKQISQSMNNNNNPNSSTTTSSSTNTNANTTTITSNHHEFTISKKNHNHNNKELDQEKWPHDKFDELNNSLRSIEKPKNSNFKDKKKLNIQYNNTLKSSITPITNNTNTTNINTTSNNNNNNNTTTTTTIANTPITTTMMMTYHLEKSKINTIKEDLELDNPYPTKSFPSSSSSSSSSSSTSSSSTTSNDKDIFRLGLGVTLEDDKLSLSNVSTEISERQKNWDDDTLPNVNTNTTTTANTTPPNILSSNIKNENKSISKEKRSTGSNSSENFNLPLMGIEFLIQNKNHVYKVKILENETDYETLLDKICKENEITGSFSLHFKILLVKYLKELTIFDITKLDILYNKLLDINFKLILYQLNKEYNQNNDEDNQILLPYLDNINNIKENEQILSPLLSSDKSDNNQREF